MDPDKKETIHHILSYSYFVYFAGVVIGLLLDLVFPIRLIPESIGLPAGALLLFGAPLLILWAQRTSASFRGKKTKCTKEDFMRGPYSFSRKPTHVGLFFMTLGFGLIVNSISLIAATVVAFFITSHYFLERGEKILEASYGDDYREYKRHVRSWF